MTDIERLKTEVANLNSDITLLHHNLDEALTMIAQVQQAVLENDEKLETAHRGSAKLARALLDFYQNYKMPQAVLENDEKLETAHRGSAKLARALLDFYQKYKMPHVK